VLKTKFRVKLFAQTRMRALSFGPRRCGTRRRECSRIVIFDKAVEQRAQTDEEFGSYFGRSQAFWATTARTDGSH
jgi:hypothetical protein